MRITNVILFFIVLFVSCTPALEKEIKNEEIKQEILALLPEQSETQIGIILTKYTLNYLSNRGESLPQIEELILTTAPLKYMVNILTIVVKKNFFSPFTDRLLEKVKANIDSFNGNTALITRKLVFLYPAIKLYNQNPKKTRDDWMFIRDSIVASKEIIQSNLYDTILLTAYKKLKNNKEFFRLKAYKYLNEDNFSLFKRLELYFNYFLIDEKKDDFETELTSVMTLLKADITRHVVIGAYMPINDEYFKEAGKKGETLLSFKNEDSPLYKKKSVMIFFSLTCGYCKKIFKSLIQLLKDNPRYSENYEILGIKIPVLEKLSFMDNLDLYKKNYKIPIPLYENDKSDMFSRLKVTSVPRIYFFNEEGRIIQVIQFTAYGHLDLKLRWFFDELL